MRFWFHRTPPIVLVIGTPVLAKTKSGAVIRGVVRTLLKDHSKIGVLMAGIADHPDAYLWFEGKDLTIDTQLWKE